MATLTLDNDAQTVFDLTGVTGFDVISQPGSLKWITRAIIPNGNMQLIVYKYWHDAQLAQKALTKHVLVEDVDVYEHPDTGSIVPV